MCIRDRFLVTIERPSVPRPATSSVAHTGSPENNWLYEGIRANLTIQMCIRDRPAAKPSKQVP